MAVTWTTIMLQLCGGSVSSDVVCVNSCVAGEKKIKISFKGLIIHLFYLCIIILIIFNKCEVYFCSTVRLSISLRSYEAGVMVDKMAAALLW